MSNENKPNKPDWSDLQNAQDYTSAWQINKIWEIAKKTPIYLWVIIFVVFCTLGFVFKLVESNDKLVEDNKANAVDQMMLQAYSTIALNVAPMNLQQYIGVATDEQWVHFAKTAAERNSDKPIEVVRGIPELMKINGVAEIVNAYVKDQNTLQDSLSLKIIGKQFYHAVANELAGKPQEKINHHLDKMFSGNHERALKIKENWIADALNLGAMQTAEGVGQRIEIVKDEGKYETFVKMNELKKQNPKAWDEYLKNNHSKECTIEGIGQ